MSRMYRSGANFAKPENALKRSEELEAVGQKQAAVQALHDVITSKRHRTWQKTLEDIMFKYIDLCVEMKRGRYAKDGLIQYRNVCLQVNVGSLEEVIKYFLKEASSKAEEAQAQAESQEPLSADLEEDVAPEDLMLSYVSGDKSKDRTERELVTPWFKFLWETYRNVLDILRNNSKLEALYAMTAQRAFQFCLQYKRTTEFRRLCDILRNHLTHLSKYREQRDRPDLSQPESLQLYLETRFEQLKVACELEMWQEAFRSVEDIHGLMQYGKKPPKTQMMATYYAKLTQIFAVSGSNLYHAYAWYKLYNLSKQYNKNLSTEDQQMMGCSVLLAALSILPYERTEHLSTSSLEKDRAVRMATILGFSVDHKRDAHELLSRNALLSDLLAKGLHNMVPTEVSQIYKLLESDFDPLNLCKKMEPLLNSLDNMPSAMSAASPVPAIVLSQYKEQLSKLAVLRMCEQLSQVYSVIKIEKLAAMVPFVSFAQVELYVVDAVKYGYLQLRLDHRNGTLQFNSPNLSADKLKSHLATMAKRLCKAVTLIGPTHAELDKPAKATKLALEAQASLKTEHSHALARKVIIEKRKEEQEQATLEREKQEEEKRILQARINEEAEEKRLQAERAKREEERIRREMEERELEEAKSLLQAAGKKGRVLKEGEKIDRQALMHEALTEQLKERQELERKLARLTKQMDHFERAKREEEVPLLEEAYKQQMIDDEVYHKEQQAQFREQHRQGWEVDRQEKERLLRMQADRVQYQESVMARRVEEFAALQAAREQRINEARAQRKRDRELERKRRFIARTREEREERMLAEEQERLDEEQARLEAEQARIEATRRAEEEERRAKMEEIARKQREREEEIERKKEEERKALLSGSAGAAPPGARAPAPERDTWTRRDPVPAADSGARPDSSARPTGGYQPPIRRQGQAPPAARPDEDRWGRREAPRDAPLSRRDEGGSRDSWQGRPSGPPRADDPRGAPPSGGDRWQARGGQPRRDDNRRPPPPRTEGNKGDRW
mmetsp:Transcript_33886/g.95996  ORF Transcript_33886/g.95996 Transcript_33886/m.95996 type:complete len:1014 (-) Transcript_33886:241-3282(-)